MNCPCTVSRRASAARASAAATVSLLIPGQPQQEHSHEGKHQVLGVGRLLEVIPARETGPGAPTPSGREGVALARKAQQ
jgi:hypothetical protein